jgi:hypothetical protein
MRRSAFLWITSIAAAAWGSLVYARPSVRPEIALAMRSAQPTLAWTNTPGRCAAARKTSRWSGYTSDDVLS